jgi:hypothetical protein
MADHPVSLADFTRGPRAIRRCRRGRDAHASSSKREGEFTFDDVASGNDAKSAAGGYGAKKSGFDAVRGGERWGVPIGTAPFADLKNLSPS